MHLFLLWSLKADKFDGWVANSLNQSSTLADRVKEFLQMLAPNLAKQNSNLLNFLQSRFVQSAFQGTTIHFFDTG